MPFALAPLAKIDEDYAGLPHDLHGLRRRQRPAAPCHLVLGEANDAAFIEASNSISTASDGESDLIAIYARGDHRLAVMLENKISASFMPWASAVRWLPAHCMPAG